MNDFQQASFFINNKFPYSSITKYKSAQLTPILTEDSVTTPLPVNKMFDEIVPKQKEGPRAVDENE